MNSYMTYQGIVTIKTKNITTHKHNVGSNKLFNLICRFLCGNQILERELPFYVHLVNPDTISSTNSLTEGIVDSNNSYGFFPSIVVRTVPQDGNMLELQTTINSNQYNKSGNGGGKLTLALTDQTYNILALYQSDNLYYRDLQDGFQAEVTWCLRFENKVEAKDNVVSK